MNCHYELYCTYSVTCSNTGCMAPLGMENNQISDAQISASSVSDDRSSPGQARLHLPGGRGWSAFKNDPHQWLQVDLRSYTTVTRVATQGRTGTKEWVTKYKLQYSDDGMNFQFYKEHADKSAKVFYSKCQIPYFNLSFNWAFSPENYV